MTNKRAVIFRPEADSELTKAARWYEEQRRGLGSEFMRAVEAALEAVLRSPETFPKVSDEMSRAVVKRFPFGVFFSFTPSEIVVLAIFHFRRDQRQLTKRH